MPIVNGTMTVPSRGNAARAVVVSDNARWRKSGTRNTITPKKKLRIEAIPDQKFKDFQRERG